MIPATDSKVCKVFSNPIQTQLLTWLVLGLLGPVLCPRIIQMKKRSQPLRFSSSLLQTKGRHTVWHHLGLTNWSISAWHPNFERYRRPMIWPPCSWLTTTLTNHASLAGRWVLCKSYSYIFVFLNTKKGNWQIFFQPQSTVWGEKGGPPADQKIPFQTTGWGYSALCVCPPWSSLGQILLSDGRWNDKSISEVKMFKIMSTVLLASLKLILTSSGTSCITIRGTEKIMQDGVLSKVAGVFPQTSYWYICWADFIDTLWPHLSLILFFSNSGTKLIALKGFEEGQKPDFLVGNLSCMEDVPLFDKIKDRCE